MPCTPVLNRLAVHAWAWQHACAAQQPPLHPHLLRIGAGSGGIQFLEQGSGAVTAGPVQSLQGASRMHAAASCCVCLDLPPLSGAALLCVWLLTGTCTCCPF